jgi:hypothetical protein
MDARPMSALPPGFVLDRDRPKSELRSLFATMQAQRGGGELRQLLQGRAQAPGPVGPALPPGFVLDTPTRHLDALLAKYPALPPAPTSGVTIAPKGGVAREATAGEARAIGPGASWADVAGQAGENLLPSAQRFGSDLLNVVQHPKETGKAFLKAAAGGVEKLIPGEQEHEPYANAVGQFFADRYGGMEAFKKTLAEDPVGFAAWPRSFPGANWLLREHPAWLVKSVALPERSDVPSIRSMLR